MPSEEAVLGHTSPATISIGQGTTPAKQHSAVGLVVRRSIAKAVH